MYSDVVVVKQSVWVEKLSSNSKYNYTCMCGLCVYKTVCVTLKCVSLCKKQCERLWKRKQKFIKINASPPLWWVTVRVASADRLHPFVTASSSSSHQCSDCYFSPSPSWDLTPHASLLIDICLRVALFKGAKAKSNTEADPRPGKLRHGPSLREAGDYKEQEDKCQTC